MNDLSALVAIRIGEVFLDNLMDWTDEFKYVDTTVVADRVLDGSLFAQKFFNVAGRPITLSGSTNRGWQKRQTVALLHSMASIEGFQSFKVQFLGPLVGLNYTVLREFNCRFRQEDAPAVEFDPVTPVDNPDPYFWYQGTIKLITI